MLYTLELRNKYHEKFRLQKDNSWRKLDPGIISLISEDFATTDSKELIEKSCPINKNYLSDEVVLNEKSYSLLGLFRGYVTDDTTMKYYSTILRKDYPKMPEREQLIDCIKNGNDWVDNSLVLNINGCFELQQHSVDDLSTVLRFQTIPARNRRVGHQWDNEPDDYFQRFIDLYYTSAISYWIIHLKTGEILHYTLGSCNSDLSSLLSELKTTEENWIPQY